MTCTPSTRATDVPPDFDEPPYDELEPAGDAAVGGPSLLSIAAAKVARVGDIVVDQDVVEPSSYAGEETWVGLDATVADLYAALQHEAVQEKIAPLRAGGNKVGVERIVQVFRIFAERADSRTGRYIILSPERVAAIADCHERTVQKALEVLHTLGVMRTSGTGRIGGAVTPAERLAMRQAGDRQHGVPVVRRVLRVPSWIRRLITGAPSLQTRRYVTEKDKRNKNITKRRGVDNSISRDALRIARELDRPGQHGGRFLRGRAHLHALARALDRFGVSSDMSGDAIWDTLGHSPALSARSPIGWLLSRLRPGQATPVLTLCDKQGHAFQSSGWCAHCETRRDDDVEADWFVEAEPDQVAGGHVRALVTAGGSHE